MCGLVRSGQGNADFDSFSTIRILSILRCFAFAFDRLASHARAMRCVAAGAQSDGAAATAPPKALRPPSPPPDEADAPQEPPEIRASPMKRPEGAADQRKAKRMTLPLMGLSSLLPQQADSPSPSPPESPRAPAVGVSLPPHNHLSSSSSSVTSSSSTADLRPSDKQISDKVRGFCVTLRPSNCCVDFYCRHVVCAKRNWRSTLVARRSLFARTR